MNDVDYKLKKRFKMFDDIDNLIKGESMATGGNTKRANNYTISDSRNEYKCSDRYSNFSSTCNDIDYPLQLESVKSAKTPGGNRIFQAKNAQQPNELFSTKEGTDATIGKSKKKISDNLQSRQVNRFYEGNRKTSKSPKPQVNININIDNSRNIRDSSREHSGCGDRLYNYGLYLKEKLEKKRADGEESMRRGMTPDITHKARKLVRDPKKCHERLYPYHKISKKSDEKSNADQSQSGNHIESCYSIQSTGNFIDYTNQYRLTKDSEKNEQMSKIYRRNQKVSPSQFEYRPKLDKNSLKIAEQFGPPRERLTRKKSRQRSKSVDKYQDTSGYLSGSNVSKSPGGRLRTASNKYNDLYQMGLEKMKKREVLHRQKKQSDGQEYTKYSFKPKILTRPLHLGVTRSPSKSSRSPTALERSSRSPQQLNFYNKNLNWKKKLTHKQDKAREHSDNNLKQECSFRPDVNKRILKEDEKFIQNNIGQIESYVKRRRSTIQKQKEDEEYKKKKFSHGENYKMKVTVPQKFQLHTENRGRSTSKSNNRSVDIKRSRSPQNVNLMREQLKTHDFFEDKSSADNKYFTSRVNGSSRSPESARNKYRSSASKQEKISMDEDSQFAFLDAVNNLHNKLVNLKF